MKNSKYYLSRMFAGVTVTLLVTAFNTNSYGQDTLIMTNNTEIVGKVTEISKTEIKYKKADNTNGPVYVVDKWQVSKIKYSNGTTEVLIREYPLDFTQTNLGLIKSGKGYLYNGTRLKEREMQSKLLLLNDKELTRHVKKARWDKGLQYVGFAAIPCVGLAMLGGLLQEDAVVAGGLGLGAVCVASSFYFKFDRNRQNAAAVKKFNEEFR